MSAKLAPRSYARNALFTQSGRSPVAAAAAGAAAAALFALADGVASRFPTGHCPALPSEARCSGCLPSLHVHVQPGRPALHRLGGSGGRTDTAEKGQNTRQRWRGGGARAGREGRRLAAATGQSAWHPQPSETGPLRRADRGQNGRPAARHHPPTTCTGEGVLVHSYTHPQSEQG